MTAARQMDAPDAIAALPVKTQLALAAASIAALETRCTELEDEVSTLKNETMHFVACDECGVVFKDRDAWGEHLCNGKQGL